MRDLAVMCVAVLTALPATNSLPFPLTIPVKVAKAIFPEVNLNPLCWFPLKLLGQCYIKCDKSQARLSQLGALSPFIPQCDGRTYLPTQCYKLSRHTTGGASPLALTWQVDYKGARQEGTTKVGAKCNTESLFPSKATVPCKEARKLIEEHTPPGHTLYYPVCTSTGEYYQWQCYNLGPVDGGPVARLDYTTRQGCWCADPTSGRPTKCP